MHVTLVLRKVRVGLFMSTHSDYTKVSINCGVERMNECPNRIPSRAVWGIS